MITTLDSKDKQISATIANIRLPLLLGVVLCHCMIPDARVQPFSCVQTLLSQVLTQPCVPIFFIMSGFLFFWKVEKLDVRLYKKKMKSRTKSLIIPYLLWNVICVIFYAFLHKFMQGYINPENQNVLQYSVKDMLLSLWDGAGGFPINYPLWFLRNLIVVTILAPLFYIVAYRMGYIRYITLLMLTLLFLMVSSNWIFTVFFFYVGVMLAKEIEMVKSAICRVRGRYFVIVNH